MVRNKSRGWKTRLRISGLRSSQLGLWLARADNGLLLMGLADVRG
jgi:hypothetical protein